MDFFDCYRTVGLFVTNLCCNDSRSFFFTGYSSALIYRCDIFCSCCSREQFCHLWYLPEPVSLSVFHCHFSGFPFLIYPAGLPESGLAFTVTLQVAVFSPQVAVIVVVPAPTAVTKPFFTVATEGSSLFHSIGSVGLPVSSTFAFNCMVPSFSSVISL